jgi:glycosyltransferase involved in cell wall biosynthesis
MRLLVATPLYPPELGGPATYVKLLEQGFQGKGIHIAIAKFASVRRYPKLLRHLVYCVLLIRAGKDADLILALDPVSTGLPALLAATVLRKPFVLKIGGDYAWEQGRQRFGVTAPLDIFVQERQHSFGVLVLQKIQTYVARRARLVIVPSNYLKGIVHAWGIPEESIRIIFNAVSATEVGAIPQSAMLPRPRIVSVGRLVPWKGMGGLIDAMTMVREACPTASLTIVGDGPDRANLEAYAAARLGHTFSFTGAVLHEEVLAIFREADILVLNSTYEGLSHLLIEAQIMGTPTIATQVGGNGEVITDGVDGILVQSGDRTALSDAIVLLARDTALAARFHENAKNSSTRFSVASMLDETEAVLISVL